MRKISVSNLECFRQWESNPDLDLHWLMERLSGIAEQTPAMRAGEAFHKALETFQGEADVLTADGFTFQIDCEIELIQPDAREMRIAKVYDDVLRVTGRVDAIFGNTVYDHKTTERFDPDRMWDGYQWRFYLDALEMGRFVWNIFEMEEVDFKQYRIKAFHPLEQRRYPQLSKDCRELALRFAEFAKTYLPKADDSLGITEADVVLGREG